MLSDIKSGFIKKLLEENLFSFIDYFFAFRLLKSSEDEGQFLALSYLFKAARLGHLCVKVEKNISPPCDLLFKQEIDENTIIDSQIEGLITNGFTSLPDQILEKNLSNETSSKPVYFYQNSYYLQRNYYFESCIAEHLKNVKKHLPSELDQNILNEQIELLLSKKEILEAQAEAIRLVAKSSLSFIFGGPGTGKTHTAVLLINVFSKAFVKKELKILIGSITGKAANHLLAKMKAVPNIKIEAMTLHSLLKIGSKKEPFLDADIIIIDEASMIDARILSSLFQAVSPTSRLVLIGDPDQLPPIESGNIFASFCSSKFEKQSCILTEVLRFDNPRIYHLSRAVKDGDAKRVTEIIKENEMISLPPDGLEENKFIKQKILEESLKHFLKVSFSDDVEKAFNAFLDFRILSSLRLGSNGSIRLNKMIYEHFESLHTNGTFIIPILILKNDYRLGIYNGTCGILIKRYSKGSFKEEAGFFDSSNKIKYIPSYLLPSYEYGYCLSIHKSQGSEFNNVLLVLGENYTFFGRELLYTAVTRAKKKIEILSNFETIEKMVANKTFLQNNLIERI